MRSKARIRLPLLLVSVLCAVAVGCEPTHEARLLELLSVAPEMVSPGDALRVRGEGFPTGEHARITLSGWTHRAGLRPERTHVTLSGRAATADRVELTLERAAFLSLRGPGSFSGELRIAFDGAESGTLVTGVIPLELDLRVPTAAALRQHHDRELEAEQLLSFLGIVPDRSVPSHDGLVVDHALEDSRGAQAGLVRGDVIVRSAGVGVHSMGDLSPPPGADTLQMVVLRPGKTHPVPIALPLAGLRAPRLAAHLVPLCLVSAVALLCLLLLGPLPSLSVWLARCRSRLRSAAGNPWLRVWDDRPVDVDDGDGARGLRLRLVRLRRLAWRLLLPVTVSLLLFGVAYLQPVLGLRFNSLPIYLGLTAVSVALSAMLARGEPVRARVAHAAAQLSRMLAVGVAIGAASALGGTPSLEGIVAVQGGLPMGWFVFSQPAMFIALPLYVVYASRIVPMEFGSGVHAHALSFMTDVGGRVLVSAIGAAVFFGGWQLSGIPQIDRVDPLIASATLFTLKAWGVAILLHLCRTIGLGDHAPGWLGALAAVASLGLTALWIYLSVPPSVSLAVGHVLLATTLIALAVAWLRVVRARHPMGAPAAYPLPTA